MSQEIRANASLSITSNGFTITGNNAQVISMTGSNYFGQVMTLSTAYTQIPTGSLGSVRYLFVSNESTGSVDITHNTATASFIRLKPDDVVLLPPADYNKTWYLKSSLGAADVQVVMVEE